jgi:hypothetical protein
MPHKKSNSKIELLLTLHFINKLKTNNENAVGEGFEPPRCS